MRNKLKDTIQDFQIEAEILERNTDKINTVRVELLNIIDEANALKRSELNVNEKRSFNENIINRITVMEKLLDYITADLDGANSKNHEFISVFRELI